MTQRSTRSIRVIRSGKNHTLQVKWQLRVLAQRSPCHCHFFTPLPPMHKLHIDRLKMNHLIKQRAILHSDHPTHWEIDSNTVIGGGYGNRLNWPLVGLHSHPSMMHQNPVAYRKQTKKAKTKSPCFHVYKYTGIHFCCISDSTVSLSQVTNNTNHRLKTRKPDLPDDWALFQVHECVSWSGSSTPAEYDTVLVIQISVDNLTMVSLNSHHPQKSSQPRGYTIHFQRRYSRCMVLLLILQKQQTCSKTACFEV